MERLSVATYQGHALFTAGNQYTFEIKLVDQSTGFRDQLFIRLSRANHSLKLAEVWGNQGRASVLLKVGAFRIDQNGDFLRLRCLNKWLRVGQRAFAVIRQNHHTCVFQAGFKRRFRCRNIHRVESIFKVEANQLLLTADNPQLGNGRMGVVLLEITGHTGILQQTFEQAGIVVLTGNTQKVDLAAQNCDVQRNVARTTSTVFGVLNFHHGHRCLGRNA